MTPCPICGGPLERVTYLGGPFNRDQWEDVRAGDWFCTRCPEEVGTAGRARTGYAYFWDHDVATPARVEGACEALARFMTWVVMEAAAARYFDPQYLSLHQARERAFLIALEFGRLRLEWPR